MRSDDLVDIIAAPATRELRLREAVATSWNTTTGANVVAIGGASFTNLRVIGSPAGITAPAAVMVIGDGTTWYVLGRLLKP